MHAHTHTHTTGEHALASLLTHVQWELLITGLIDIKDILYQN